jgi:hypothetical protein
MEGYGVESLLFSLVLLFFCHGVWRREPSDIFSYHYERNSDDSYRRGIIELGYPQGNNTRHAKDWSFAFGLGETRRDTRAFIPRRWVKKRDIQHQNESAQAVASGNSTDKVFLGRTFLLFEAASSVFIRWGKKGLGEDLTSTFVSYFTSSGGLSPLLLSILYCGTCGLYTTPHPFPPSLLQHHVTSGFLFFTTSMSILLHLSFGRGVHSPASHVEVQAQLIAYWHIFTRLEGHTHS